MEHIIWSNYDINVADYADFLQENYPEITDPDKQYELCCEMNYAYLDDEKANLDMELPHEYVSRNSRSTLRGCCPGSI